jgi:hypothetical protein
MNLTNLLTTVLANKHTSGAALVFGVVKAGSRIAATWSPEHKAQIDTTADVVEGLAVLYLGAAAGDAARSATKEEVQTVTDAVVSGDTTMLLKSELPPQDKSTTVPPTETKPNP